MNAYLDTQDRNAEQIVRGIGIPPCPAILTRLLRETRADEPDFQRVGQLIGGDVGLAAAILNIVNSPFYGLRDKATSIRQALSLLDLGAVTQLVTGLLLRQAFPTAAGPGIERYWKTSMATSLIAALLSRETGRADSGVSSMYALFRDCGMPVMLRKFPIYADILDGSALACGDPIIEIEGERYGTNHARVGAHLARSWHLSEPLCFAILHHHDMLWSAEIRSAAEPEARVLVAIGLAAEQIYCNATDEACHEWDLAGEWALAILDLTPEKLTRILSRIKGSMGRL